MDQAFIERIVQDVLAQLQPASPVRANIATVPTSNEVLLEQAVITAEMLQDRVPAGHTLRIGARTVLTPTARDWLKERKIRVLRAGRGSASGAECRQQLLIATVTPAVRTLRDALPRELPGWKSELLGRPIEIVEHATRVLTASEADLVVALSDAADVVACRANRNERLRAAVVASPDHLRPLADHLGPNLLVINPRNRTYMDLRNLLRAAATLPVPKPPREWN